MGLSKLLIANRGEIAIRIARAAAELDLPTVAVHSEDDAASLHVRRAGESRQLPGAGAAAYLDIDQVVAAAIESGCDAIHPGYGFLAENAGLARACEAAGITFVGPTTEALALFGDKSRARALAASAGVPVLPGSAEAVTLDEARAFLDSLGDDGAIVIKAVSGGGGGRGMRVVTAPGRTPLRLRARPLRGRRRLRQRRRLRRAPDLARSTHRGADRRRRHRGDHPPRRARMQRAAPPPEGRRDRPEPEPHRLATHRHHRRRPRRRPSRPLPQPRHHRVPRRRTERGRILLHRGQRPPPGRAHRHRGGHRHRSRPGPAPHRRR